MNSMQTKHIHVKCMMAYEAHSIKNEIRYHEHYPILFIYTAASSKNKIIKKKRSKSCVEKIIVVLQYNIRIIFVSVLVRMFYIIVQEFLT